MRRSRPITGDSSARARWAAVREPVFDIAARPSGRAVVGSTALGSGHGLTGIRERAALFDGTVGVGPQPGGGSRLTVELPIARSSAAR